MQNAVNFRKSTHPSGANNKNILIFVGEKNENSVRQKNRYLNCIELRLREQTALDKMYLMKYTKKD